MNNPLRYSGHFSPLAPGIARQKEGALPQNAATSRFGDLR